MVNENDSSKLKLVLCFLDKDNIIRVSTDMNVTYNINGNNLLKDDEYLEEITKIINMQIEICLKKNFVKEMLKKLIEE